ncbi:outer membrane protein assembly factor BamA, partial [Candidatus Pelagibacter sp.]|nr:outer membrane protein assembly factor BamA [Candidatus Pelagibacter sp.]
TISNVEINGNERITKETIILFGQIDLNNEIDDNELNIILKNLYETNFFEDIKLKIIDQTLIVNVKEFPLISSLEIVGVKAKKIKNPILENINLKNKGSFNEYLAGKDKDIVINVLRSFGYYFAKVDIKIIDQPNKTIKLIYEIEMGKKALIRNINFIGDKVYKKRKLYDVITSEESKFWKIISNNKHLDEDRVRLDVRLLTNFYKNKGFYYAEVNSSFAEFSDDGKFDLTFNINAGEKYYFNKLNLNLPPDFDERYFLSINKQFSKLKGESYSFKRIEKILKEIERIALLDQYQSINASVNVRVSDNNKLDFNFDISEISKQYVERINILGNNITREDVLRQKFALDEGDTYNEILLNKSINNLKSLNFFKSVISSVSDGSNSDMKIINIEVDEKATGEIFAGAGFGTNGGTIGFGIKENNFMGKGIQFDTNLELSEEQIRGQFSVYNPNFKGSDNALSTNIQSLTNDLMSDYGYKTTKTGVSFGTRFEYYENLFLSPSVSSFYESLKTTNTASNTLKKQRGTYFDTDVDYTLDFDKRDQNFQTTDGFRSRFTQSIPLISETNALLNGYELNLYEEIADEMVGEFTFYVRAINSITDDDVRISERLFLPSSRLRGFERGKIGPKDGQEFIGGNYASSVNLSTSLPTIFNDLETLDFNIFLDAGNVWGVDYESTLDESNKIRSSTGIAVDWYTIVGPLSFSYSIPLSKADTDIEENFRFQIGTTF